MARRVPVGRVARSAGAGHSRGLAPALAGYTRPQRRVIRAIDRRADMGDATRRERLAALMTGLVESNLTNVRHGHGTSVNWRQEIDSYGSVEERMKLPGSVDRFFDEAAEFRGRKMTPGQLAQAVQRSAFPDRYAEQRGQALDLLRATRRIDWPGGKVSGGGAGGVPGRAPSLERDAVGPEAGTSALLRALAEADRPAPVGGSPLTSPGHSAAPAVAQGYQAPASGGGPAPPRPDVSELMALVQPGSGLPGSTLTPGDPGAAPGARPGRQGGGSARGRVTGQSGSRITEVFHDPLGEYFDSGQTVRGAIGGHGGHVHVAGSPRVMVDLGREAQRRGLSVRENPFFDPVDPVHTGGSFHYRSRRIRRRGGGLSRKPVGYAIDVSGGSAQDRAEFARYAMRLAGGQ